MPAPIGPKRRQVQCARGCISFLEAGSGQPLVLLHGIGACADAWSAQFDFLAHHYRVIAWDAPGYGESSPLANPQPDARDYADAFSQFLAAVQVHEPHLVGHSLGAIMAAAWAASPRSNARSLLLASPARGYGASDTERRQAVYAERVNLLAELGEDGLAQARAPRLCAPSAAPEIVSRVKANMKQITQTGYGQAAYLLSNASLPKLLEQIDVPMGVIYGAADAVTRPEACAEIAAAIGRVPRVLPGVGHACYVEAPDAFNAAVLAFHQSIEGQQHE